MEPTPRPPKNVLIGSYTTDLPHVRGRGPGISICHFEPESGELEVLQESPAIDASFLLSAADGLALYAAEERFEYQGRETGSVASCRFVNGDLRLEPINRVPSGGTGPVYLEMSPDDRFVLVANFWGSTVSVLPVDSDGALGEPNQVLTLSGSGPNPERQKQSHPHGLMFDKRSGLLYISDLGTDAIVGYAYHPEDGSINEPVTSLDVPAGVGPRHMRMHPDGEHLFVINELIPSATVYRSNFDSFDLHQNVDIAPPGAPRDSIASELAIHPSGRFVYAGVRGSNTIARLTFDTETGRLELVDHTETAGATPRHMALDPTGSFLVVGNQDSDSVSTFKVDVDSGGLDRLKTLPHPSPAFIEWVGDKR